MIKLFRKIWGLLLVTLCILVSSCNKDEITTPEIKPDTPVNTGDVEKVLKSATTEWGISRDAVISYMDGYKSIYVADNNMLQFKPENGGQSIAYRFADDKLIATAVLLPTTSAELELQSMLNGYAYFAKLSDGEVYENRTANTLATVWNPAEANSSYSAIGFAPIKYANYGMSSSITVNTGEVSDIATKSVTLSGNLTGVTTSVEVGFFYGTENTLTEQSDKKSTTSSSNFSVTLTELSSNTTYYYRAYAIVDDMSYYGEIKTFTTKVDKTCPDNNHPHMIDLGLPSGTMWACCNVGASAPEEYGNYYAWGETSPKSVYDWSTYKYGSSENNVVNIGSDIAGTQYDAATANWGSPWQMPSLVQMSELHGYTTSTWTTKNGVNGRKFTGPNGGTIFLPAAGDRDYGELDNLGSNGEYLSSTLLESTSSYIWVSGFCSDEEYWLHSYRCSGHSVRPVR